MASEDTVTVEHHGPPPSQQRKTWEPYGKIATRQGVNMGALKCKVCDRVYSKSEHLKRHQRSHTKERPYQCPVCKKYFSRSDVLRRHQKNHQNSDDLTAPPSKQDNEKSTDSSKRRDTAPDNSDPISVQAGKQQKKAVPDTTQSTLTSQIMTDDSAVPRAVNEFIMAPALLQSTHMSEALPEFQTLVLPPDEVTGSVLTDQVSINSTGSRDLPIQHNQRMAVFTGDPDPSLDRVASSSALSNTQPQDLGYTVDLSQLPSVPSLDDLQLGPSTDILDSWLYQFDPTLSMTPIPDLFASLHIPTWISDSQLGILSSDNVTSENVEGNLSPRSRFTNKVSDRRFQKIQSHWHSRSGRATRLMPNLWHELAVSERRNLYCKEASQSLGSEICQRQVSRWGFDDDCRQQMQLTLNSLTQAAGVCSPQSSSSAVPDNISRAGSTASYSFGEAILPSTETCEVALEIYFHQFHPTLPFIHLPTFSAKGAEFPMLFVLCLVGFSILGTPSATKLVSDTFPMVIQLISTELQSNAARKGSIVAQLNLLATGLLALNLASITGNSRRMAQAETLYVNLISISQWHGLFSSNGDHVAREVLEEIVDDEARWHAWSKIECVKRLIVGLVEIDDWFASYFSTTPMIRSETLQILPPAENRQFHASTCSFWMQLTQKTQGVHTPYIGASFDMPPEGLQLSALPSLLTLHQHQIYEANYRLVVSTERQGVNQVLEPWRLYQKESKDLQLLSRLVGLPSTSADPLNKADINGVISWHMSCMMLTASMRLFEEAAGMSGPGAVSRALDAISNWACTPTARRAVLHAAQVFKLLFHRRVSDVISVHAVATLFKSALVLSFYLLMAPQHDVMGFDRPLELFEEIDWSQVGNCGLSDVNGSATDVLGISQGSQASLFIREGGAFSITGIVHPPGYSSCGRVLLHAADLMQTLGKWKSRTFSQILHLLTDDLMDIDAVDGEDADVN